MSTATRAAVEPPRRRRLGGSDIGALFGVDPNRTQLDVYERIVHGVYEPQNRFMLRGIKTEPRLRAMYLAETGAQLVSPVPKPEPWVIQHPNHDWACVSPDDWAITSDGLLATIDYKSASRWSANKWGPGADEMPAHYLLQLAWAMCVGSKDWAELYVGFGEDADDDSGDFEIVFTRLYRAERDLELEDKLLNVAGDWWRRHVVGEVPPPDEPDHPKHKRKKRKS
jgi:putative phage-type endonuclease